LLFALGPEKYEGSNQCTIFRYKMFIGLTDSAAVMIKVITSDFYITIYDYINLVLNHISRLFSAFDQSLTSVILKTINFFIFRNYLTFR
jgi:hypothetical protein